MSSFYGRNITVSIFGQSHSEAIGAVIDGLPAGFRIDMDALRVFMGKRAPGKNYYSTPRKETDTPEFLSGLVDGVTCGAPLSVVIRNEDTRSKDYDELRDTPRPSHSDYTSHVKHGGYADHRGGGHLSGRLTAPLCVAGGICLQLLERKGIVIAAHIANIGGIEDATFHPVNLTVDDLVAVKKADFPVIIEELGAKMCGAIEYAQDENDSLGGIIECAALGIPAGVGDPIFDGVENRIAGIVFGIPAVCGIEFGAGFAVALPSGSANNDEFYIENGEVRTRTNNHGGILGGMTSGMPVIFRVAVKPTPSIGKEQNSVSLSRREDVKLEIKGRHDPCIVPRAVPCVEAATAIALYDLMRWD
jgi:chorismate synthase